MIVRRPAGLRSLSALRAAVPSSPTETRAALEQLAQTSGAFFAATALDIAQNPMLTFWLVVARLCRLGTAALTNARGIATWRVRTDPAVAYGDAVEWSLTPNVGVPAVNLSAQHVFPY